jgi:hypothetical protein
MYDPVLGRFISVDPVMDLSDPQQWNAYSYSNGNPLTWSDPTGMLPGLMLDGKYGSTKGAAYARRQNKKAKEIASARPPWYQNPTTYAGHASTVAGVATAGATAARERKLVEKKALRLKSGNPATRAADNAAWQRMRTNPAVRASTKLAMNPVAQKAAGPVGVGAGVIIGMPNYHDANGGDWAFAGMQAGQDAIMSTAGGMAGAILAGVLVTALTLTGVGAILLVGGLVLAGATAGALASQKANEGHSKSHRERGWR